MSYAELKAGVGVSMLAKAGIAQRWLLKNSWDLAVNQIKIFAARFPSSFLKPRSRPAGISPVIHDGIKLSCLLGVWHREK